MRKVADPNASRRNLILHPIRLRLLTELTGRSLTSQQLAAVLPDVPQASLYRHIKILVEGGLFEVVAETAVNGATERTYAVSRGGGRLTSDDLGSMTPREHQDAFHLFVASLSERFARYIEHADLKRLTEDGLSYNGTVLYLSEEERSAFQEKVMTAVGGFAALGPTPGRRKYTLASIVIPDDTGVLPDDTGVLPDDTGVLPDVGSSS